MERGLLLGVIRYVISNWRILWEPFDPCSQDSKEEMIDILFCRQFK